MIREKVGSIIKLRDGALYKIQPCEDGVDSCNTCDISDYCDEVHGDIDWIDDEGTERIGVNCDGGLKLLNKFDDLFNELSKRRV